MWEGLLFFCAIDTSSSDHFQDCFYLLAKSEGSKPWSSFGTPTRDTSTCHLHSPFLEVQLRGNWIRIIIQSDLEKLVPNQTDQSINSWVHRCGQPHPSRCLLLATCKCCWHSWRLVARQRAKWAAGLSGMLCSRWTHGAGPLSQNRFPGKLQVLKHSIFNDVCGFRSLRGGWR